MSMSQHDQEQMSRGFWTTGAFAAPVLLMVGLVLFIVWEPWAIIIAGVGFLSSCILIPGYVRYRRHRREIK